MNIQEIYELYQVDKNSNSRTFSFEQWCLNNGYLHETKEF